MRISKELPKELRPVLAELSSIDDLGKNRWFEVVYYDDQIRYAWCSFANSDTFKRGGDRVLNWVYADEAIMHRTNINFG